MTELSPLGTCAPPDDPGRTAQVSGRPAFGVDLLLTDADGRAKDRMATFMAAGFMSICKPKAP